MGNAVITKFSNKTVWWKCSQCPDGHLHQWQARVSHRSRGTGCPQCAGKKLCKHNSLATKAPSVAAYWDIAKNGCSADMVLAHSNHPAHWRCDVCKHAWITTPNSKVMSNSGCPNCNTGRGQPRKRQPTFAACQHPLLAEWDHACNAADGHFPDKVTLKSSKKIHWLCNKCPLGQQHSWTATPGNRVSSQTSSGCPFCAGSAVCTCNSLQTHHAAIAAEWDHDRNSRSPQDYTFASSSVVWWRNAERGSWQQSISSRTSSVAMLVAARKYVKEQL